MVGPLLVLAVGAVAAGFVFEPSFIGEGREAFWRGAIFVAQGNEVLENRHHIAEWVAWAPLAVTILGLVSAWWMYIPKEGMGARMAAREGPLWKFLYNKWYFDELYEATFVRGAKALGDLFWKGGDKAIIDGLGPDGVSATSYAIGRQTGRLQTGYVYHYAFVMLLGVMGLLSYALWVFAS